MVRDGRRVESRRDGVVKRKNRRKRNERNVKGEGSVCDKRSPKRSMENAKRVTSDRKGRERKKKKDGRKRK